LLSADTYELKSGVRRAGAYIVRIWGLDCMMYVPFIEGGEKTPTYWKGQGVEKDWHGEADNSGGRRRKERIALEPVP